MADITKADIINISKILSGFSFKTDDTILKLTAIITAIINGILIYNKVCYGWLIVTTALVAIILLIIFLRNAKRDNIETFVEIINKGAWTGDTIDLLKDKVVSSGYLFKAGQKILFDKFETKVTAYLDANKSPDTTPVFIAESDDENNITSQLSFRALLIVVVASLLSCFGTTSQPTETNKSVTAGKCIYPFDTIRLYTSALQDAMVPLPDEQDLTGLVVIDSINPKDVEFDTSKTIKVYSVKTDKSRYATTTKYSTGDHEIFVFTKVDFFKKYKCYPGVDSVCRVKQLLGLSPWNDYKYVLQFSVKLSDIFRPCTDQSISLNACSFDISKATQKAREYLVNYRDSVNYKAELKYDYPFTGLGYTYDWSPYDSSHHGISEFVIAKQKTVKIDTVYNILDFLKKGPK